MVGLQRFSANLDSCLLKSKLHFLSQSMRRELNSKDSPRINPDFSRRVGDTFKSPFYKHNIFVPSFFRQ